MAADDEGGPERCPGCQATALIAAGDDRWARRVCEHCGLCWEVAPGASGPDAARPVDSIACPGCSRRAVCESRPSWLASSLTHVHPARDGRPLLFRPLLRQDRAELAAGFLELSSESRHFRFFSAPERLRPSDLDYLTNLDYRDHFAWAAFAADEAEVPGVGVGRYIRLPSEPGHAEAAVTVVDTRHQCGIGTLLLEHLAETAVANGVTTFVIYVLWKNVPAWEGLHDVPARVRSAEPGVARLDIDLAPGGDAPGAGLLGRLLKLLVDAQDAGRAQLADGAIHASSPAAAPGSRR